MARGGRASSSSNTQQPLAPYDIYLIVSEASCKQHFFDETRAAIDAAKLDDAASRLRAELTAVLPRGGGYAVSVLPSGVRSCPYVQVTTWGTLADDPGHSLGCGLNAG